MLGQAEERLVLEAVLVFFHDELIELLLELHLALLEECFFGFFSAARENHWQSDRGIELILRQLLVELLLARRQLLFERLLLRLLFVEVGNIFHGLLAVLSASFSLGLNLALSFL